MVPRPRKGGYKGMYGIRSWILRNFAKTLYSPQDRIFLIVSNSGLIFQEIFLAGRNRSRIF